MCEDIHSPKLLIRQPPAKTDTVQHEAVVVWGWWPGGDVPCEAYLPPGCVTLFFNAPSLFNMLITRTGLNPAASFGAPAPAISTLMACLAAVGLSERGTNVLCLGIERNWERDRKKAEEERKEERERGRRGKREKCGGSMSASDKGISLPPVGRSERLTLQALALPRARTRSYVNTHFSLRISALLSGTSQQITDKTCTWQTTTTKLSITGVALWTPLSKHSHETQAVIFTYTQLLFTKCGKKNTPSCCEQKESRDASQGCCVLWDWRLFHVRHGIHPKWSEAFYLPS